MRDYRAPIGHPDNIKNSSTSTAQTIAAIYRIVPDGFKRQTASPRQASTAALVTTLEKSQWLHRDTASRLLYERQDKWLRRCSPVSFTIKISARRMHVCKFPR